MKYIDKLRDDELTILYDFLDIDDDTLYKFKNGLKTNLKLPKNRITQLFKNFKILSNIMAEGLGFEPRKELPLCRFSRPVLSTAQPSFHK